MRLDADTAAALDTPVEGPAFELERVTLDPEAAEPDFADFGAISIAIGQTENKFGIWQGKIDRYLKLNKRLENDRSKILNFQKKRKELDSTKKNFQGEQSIAELVRVCKLYKKVKKIYELVY